MHSFRSTVKTIIKKVPGVKKYIARKKRVTALAQDARSFLSYRYLHGEGIEIGALHGPLTVAEGVRVRYVDRLDEEGLRSHYPELKDYTLAPISILDDGERLSTIADESLDFIIANHFIEHCQDPIGTLKTFERRLKAGGIIYLAVPDKRQTFDRPRSCTSTEHLVLDHEEGPERSREDHFYEQVSAAWFPRATEEEVRARAKELMEMNFSIHFHVWTEKEFLDLFLTMKDRYRSALTLQHFFQNGEEFILILKKQVEQ